MPPISKTLGILIVLLAGVVASVLFGLVPLPIAAVFGGAVTVLAFLAGVQWSNYTMVSDPEKFARLSAKYLPVDEAKKLLDGSSGWLEKLRIALVAEVKKLRAS